VLRERVFNKGAPGPVEAFKHHSADFVVADTVEKLAARMNAPTEQPRPDAAALRHQIDARDLQITNPYSKDAQVQAIRNPRRFLGDRLSRTATPHRILDPAAGPLIAVKMHILTRKTLGGIQTDLDSRALGLDGQPIDGLYAAGEVAGFGAVVSTATTRWKAPSSAAAYFSGRQAGRAAARQIS
jgi:uncharacterized protein